MQYKIFKDGIKLSCLGMGVMRIPVKGDQSEIDYKKAKDVVYRTINVPEIGKNIPWNRIGNFPEIRRTY